MKNLLIFIGLLLATTMTAQEKYGHLNFGSLIASLPETKGADAQLQAYQEELIADVQKMVGEWETRARKFSEDVGGGNLAPIKQQEEQQALEAERSKILEAEQSINQKVQVKRQELLEPIVKEVEAAIEKVAKDNGYVMVFDTSSFNSILFAEESDDLMEMVKAVLKE